MSEFVSGQLDVEGLVVSSVSEIADFSETSIDDARAERVYSVDAFLEYINGIFSEIEVAIRGEVSSIKKPGHVYFSIKDAEAQSILDCAIWQGNYRISGVELEVGMEVIIRGRPNIYKPRGQFTFIAQTIEPVGEGALKKAYDELKKKLALEGVFDETRKRRLPLFPSRIGVVTSKAGAVIHDFENNLGRFGFQINLHDARVEGIQAVNSLIEAIQFFKDKPVDVLVVIRGGGSLESLQAFNNEALIREIVNYPIPVICGIGHDKDVPLFSLATDMHVSTPTAVARALNVSWEKAAERLSLYEVNIFNRYALYLGECEKTLSNFARQTQSFGTIVSRQAQTIRSMESTIANRFHSDLSQALSKANTHYAELKSHYQRILQRTELFGRLIDATMAGLARAVRSQHDKLINLSGIITRAYAGTLETTRLLITDHDKSLTQNDPNRQLRLGYSLLFSGEKLIKSIKQVQKGDALESRLFDGDILSTITTINTQE